MKEAFVKHESVNLRMVGSFSRVAHVGSVSRAAEELGYVPSAISQHVTSLERSLGDTKLFTRRPGSGLTLTAAGRALIEAADDLLAAAATFRDTAQQVSAGEGVTVRLGAYGTALTYLLPPVLARLVDREGVDAVETTELEPVDGLPLLERGDLDILIAHRYLSEDNHTAKHATVNDLGREPILLVASANGSLRRLSDCVEAHWVAGGPKDVDRQLLRRWSAAAGLTPRVRHETRDCHTAAELIASDFAVGLLPASVVGAPQLRERLRVITLPPGVRSPYRDILAITRPDFDIPGLDQLVHELRSLLRRQDRSPENPT
jgi:DNA-binding transcriptional LysR family regulator